MFRINKLHSKNLLTVLFIIAISAFGIFLAPRAFAGGDVNVNITSCTLDDDGINVSYEMIPIAGEYYNIRVFEHVLENGAQIYNFNDPYGGNMVCESNGNCTCSWGTAGPCPPGAFFVATATEPQSSILSLVTFQWDYCGSVAGCIEDEMKTGNKNCVTPAQQPNNECNDPQYPPPYDASDCQTGGCASDEVCIFDQTNYENRCIPQSVCTQAPADCSNPVNGTPTESDCGANGECGGEQICVFDNGSNRCVTNAVCISTPDTCDPGVWYQDPFDESQCGSGGCPQSMRCELGPNFDLQCVPKTACNPTIDDCAGAGETCNNVSYPCCDTETYQCLFDFYAGAQTCVVNNDDDDEDEIHETLIETVPPYAGPIVDIGSLLSNSYKIILPIAIAIFATPSIILGGYKIMVSQGDPARVKDGKESLTSGIEGLVFLLGALTILRIILVNFIGLT